MSTRMSNTLAGLIFVAIAIYTYLAGHADWAFSAVWAAIGLAFLALGIGRK